MSMTAADVAFSDYGAILRRRWKLVAMGLAAGLFMAAAALALMPKTYASSTAVMVQSTGEDGAVQGGRTSAALNLDTEAQIVKSTVVSQLALKALPAGTADDARALGKQVLVTVPPNTSVLNIAFSSPTPKGARDGATAYADAYLANRKSVAERRVKAQTDALESQIKSIDTQIDRLDKQIAKLPADSTDRSASVASREALSSQVASLTSDLVGLKSSDIIPGEIITEAQLPVNPSSPNTKILLASGLMGGLLLGLLLAYVVDRLDRRVRDRRDLDRLGLDTLVSSVAFKSETATASTQSSEEMRQLRNALLVRLPKLRPSVLVAGTSRGEAGSLVALNLAETIARSGLRVMFVSANSAHCIVTEAFGAGGRPGLSDLIRGLSRVDEAIYDVPTTPNLSVVHNGSDGSLHSELLLGARVQRVLEALAPYSDVVVIDVAPTSENADAQSLASLSSGVLLVAEAMQTQRDEVVDAITQFRHVSAAIFGAVVANVARGATKHSRETVADGGTAPFVDPAPSSDVMPEKPDATTAKASPGANPKGKPQGKSPGKSPGNPKGSTKPNGAPDKRPAGTPGPGAKPNATKSVSGPAVRPRT